MIVKALVAVAWADGNMAAPEANVIEGLLCGFDATPEEEADLLAYASVPRTLAADVPVEQLTRSDRELLLGNAALLVNADGQRDPSEIALLAKLSELLGFERAEALEIITGANLVRKS